MENKAYKKKTPLQCIMESLNQQLESAIENKNTRIKYCRCINLICKTWEEEKSGTGIKDNKYNFDKLCDVDLVLKTIKRSNKNSAVELSKHTQKSRISALIKVLSILDADKYKDAITKYQDLQNKFKADIKEDYNTSLPSEKQADNWCTLKELEDCIDINYENLQEELTQGHKNTVTLVKAMNKYMCSLLYSCKYFPPRRLEFCDVEIISPKQYEELEKKQSGANYLVLHRNKPFFSFNNYKSYRKYGEFKLNVPKELHEKLKFIFKNSPNPKHLFINPSDTSKPLPRENRFGEMLKDAFSSTGKNIKGQLIRNIYVTDRFKDPKLSRGDREAICYAMGTSVENADSIYNKIMKHDVCQFSDTD